MASLSEDDLGKLITKLEVRLGRLPTDEEVWKFIFGTQEERDLIWNPDQI